MRDLISVARARQRVLAAVHHTTATESVALAAALDRVLARALASGVDVPPFDSSAMDGFAVPAEAGEAVLRITGEARAGAPAGLAVEPGTAVRISTGAMIPSGTGAVVAVERSTEAGPRSVSVEAVPAGANIRRRGESVRRGEQVMAPGTVLGPAALGVLAGIGCAEVECAPRPRVALLATGDELVEPGFALAPGQIWSSNPPALAGQVLRAGGEVERIHTVPDEAVATRTALGEALGAADVVCVSGGVSVGRHDHVKGAFAELGVREDFWRVALKPGKPTWFGLAADGRTLAFGLPGNPVSAMVTFQLFVRPALRALQGADPTAARATAVLDEAIARNEDRDQAVRCRLRRTQDGLHAAPTGPQGSHVLTSMLAADALAMITAGPGEIATGEQVELELLD